MPERNDSSRAVATLEAITSAGGAATKMVFDVLEPTTAETVHRDVMAAHGRVDVLVNNVGHYLPRAGQFAESREAQWQGLYEVNFLHLLRMTRVVLTAINKTPKLLECTKESLWMSVLNCASLGLLLSGDNTSRRLASKLHTNYPTNRAFTATYAYALQIEGRGAEGLKLLEGLKENELQYPSIAAYYVVMLVENGNLERARTFLVYAQRANLLPEEQALLTAAARKLFPAGPEAVVAR